MATEPDLTPILEDLAAGRIDAAEAARRIDALKAAAAATAEPSDDDLAGDMDGPDRHAAGVFSQPPFVEDVPPSPRRATGAKGVDLVSVRAVARRVRIVGDGTVATAAVDGPHVLRRSGSVLEVTSDGDIGPSFDGFILLPPRSFDDLRSLGLGKELLVRVNPSIAVDAEVTAGALTTQGVPFLGKIRVTAGGATLDRVAEASDVLVQAGSATIRGDFATGRSRIRCESGSIDIELGDRSSVTVRTDVQLGKVSWAGAANDHVDEVVLGSGAARLDVGVVMGWATIKADLR
ncbi:hypothetical protein [Micropruina sp.]|uniref:hypothetical protein n=1 Tax=Micropruina sp. TaxID=2737536 RepID=UPI0039E27AA4